MVAIAVRCGRQSLRLRFQRTRRINPTRRAYSVVHEPRFETIAVTCGSHGYATMDIHNPQDPASESPIILYIPPLDLLTANPPSPPPPALLSNSTTVITLHPRWSNSYRFPTPLHDLLALYDHIITHLIPPSPRPARPIAIYSSSITASLATSLALTESRPGLRGRISAMAIKDPFLDWMGIASSLPTPSTPTSVLDLYSLRSQLFRTPEACFDAFASPILFFRTSGMHVPPKWPTAPTEEEVLAAYEAAQMGGRAVEDEMDLFPPRRKSNLRFPATGSGLRIPWVRMGVTGGADIDVTAMKKGKKRKKMQEVPDEVGLREMVFGQVEEMTRLMRRSFAMHEMKDRDEDAEAEAERRISLVGLREEDVEAEWAAEFFRDVL